MPRWRQAASKQFAAGGAGGPRRGAAGVTLLEVLISTFVIGVAILGLAALLPVGSYQINQSNQLDRGVTVGRAGFRKFNVEQMLDPTKWAQFRAQGFWADAVADNDYAPFAAASIDSDSGNFLDDVLLWDEAPPLFRNDTDGMLPTNYQNVDDWGESFLIDPLLISSAGADINSQGAAWPGKSFPYDFGVAELANMPRMPRVTLAMPGVLPDGTFGLSPLTYVQAERIFRAQDDLLFELPDDRTLRPISVLTGGLTSSNNDPVVTEYTGDYSWTAMVTRNLSEVSLLRDPTTMAVLGDQPPQSRNNYNVSIIVYHKRTLDPLQSAAGGLLGLPNERVVGLSFQGGGFGGGGVLITAGNADASSAGYMRPEVAAEYLSVRPNQWILACGWVNQPVSLFSYFSGLGAGGMTNINGDDRTTHRPIFRWYRVVSTDDGPRPRNQDGGLVWKRSLSLAGPDFKESELATSPPGGIQLYGVLVDGVIGVYEKNVSRH